MIGELKSKNTRTVHGKKVVRLKVDIPYGALTDLEVSGKQSLEYLDQRVGHEMAFRIMALEDEGQTRIDG